MGHLGDCISLSVARLNEQIVCVHKETPVQTQTVGARLG